MLSKDDILTLYLALAPYGGNLEGMRAASLAYFGKEPKRLDARRGRDCWLRSRNRPNSAARIALRTWRARRATACSIASRRPACCRRTR